MQCGPPVLIAASAFVAALMDLQVATLSLPGVAITLVLGVIVTAICWVVVLFRDVAPTTTPARLLAAQAAIGGLMPHLAFHAIPAIGLAIAECVMFTMPLWTAVFARLVDRTAAPWGALDVALALVCLAGVVLVARPWEAASDTEALGLAAALGFAACGGLLNVLMRATTLSSVDPWLMGSLQGAVTGAVALLAGAAREAAGAGLFAEVRAALSPPVAVRALLVGVLFVLTNQLRTLSLQRATSTVVATLLYTQVAWAFAFDVLVVGSRPTPEQMAGAALIVGATALPPLLAEARARGARRFGNLVQVTELPAGEETGVREFQGYEILWGRGALSRRQRRGSADSTGRDPQPTPPESIGQPTPPASICGSTDKLSEMAQEGATREGARSPESTPRESARLSEVHGAAARADTVATPPALRRTHAATPPSLRGTEMARCMPTPERAAGGQPETAETARLPPHVLGATPTAASARRDAVRVVVVRLGSCECGSEVVRGHVVAAPYVCVAALALVLGAASLATGVVWDDDGQ